MSGIGLLIIGIEKTKLITTLQSEQTAQQDTNLINKQLHAKQTLVNYSKCIESDEER